MALRFFDRAMETTSSYTSSAFTVSTTGTWANFTGQGGFQNFANTGLSLNDTFYYAAADSSGNTETGLGTWTASGTITRTTIYASNNGGAAASFSGTVTVFLSPLSTFLLGLTTQPFTGVRVARRTITTGTTDTAGATDVAVFWNSSTAGNKAETIPAPASGNDGQMLTFADEYGNASTYPITITPASGTIGKSANFVLDVSGGSVSMICDYSATNWVLT